MKSFQMQTASSEFGKLYEWDKWCKEIPRLKFKPSWEVQIIPPFAGAVVRFVVYKSDKFVSVYLDCYDNLGHFSAPHWEIYPDRDDNNLRFEMNDTENLIKAINTSFNKMGAVSKRNSNKTKETTK